MILIHPFARPLRDGRKNPKDYPHWEQLIEQINEPIIQIGVAGETQLVEDFRTNLSLDELAVLVKECRTWIGVDSFFQHFCWDLDKPGIVLWGQSDPLIFGHPENANLLKSREYLREHQFWLWDQASHVPEAFVLPSEVLKFL